MSKAKCKIAGCREEHHAKGYCNRHYKKMLRLGNPLAGKEHASGPRKGRAAAPQEQEPAAQTAIEPEQRKAPGSGQGNFNFFLNQKFIEKLYKEAYKARTNPLYKTANGHRIPHFLTLALLMSGYDRTEEALRDYLLEELKTWLDAGDSIRFYECLAHWEKRAEIFDLQRKEKQNIRKFQPIRKAQQLTFFK